MKTLFFSVCLFLASVSATAQQRYSQEMAQSQGKQWTHGKSWDYVNGLVAKSLLNLCEQYQYADWTGNYYQWAKEYADNAINPDGTFKNFKKGNIDNINSGKVLFALYKREKELDKQNGTDNASRYKKAADFLHDYLVNDYSRIQSGDAKGCFSIKIFIPIRCGWMDFTWGLLFMLNGKLILNRTMSRLGQISLTSLKQLLAIHMIRTNSFIIMPGQQIRKIAILSGRIRLNHTKVAQKNFGDVVWDGTLLL